MHHIYQGFCSVQADYHFRAVPMREAVEKHNCIQKFQSTLLYFFFFIFKKEKSSLLYLTEYRKYVKIQVLKLQRAVYHKHLPIQKLFCMGTHAEFTMTAHFESYQRMGPSCLLLCSFLNNWFFWMLTHSTLINEKYLPG